MRLLKRTSAEDGSANEFSLIEFDVSNIPSVYAVLSHRWGSDEVLYKDLENGTATAKKGYRKLEFCAEQAAIDGITYFWIDTCCIDKSSSAELTEAINSMYKWYQRATKCYVYMSDVSSLNEDGTLREDYEWQVAFQNSQWFTRGWTLQELIAPATVEFFSAEKRKLGDKQSLQPQISFATNLPPEALRGDLGLFSINQRLLWAENRQTAREEDAAYCMLGLVDVHMPLIYGEGRHKAIARLRKELEMYLHASTSIVSDIERNDILHNEGLSRKFGPQQQSGQEMAEWETFLKSLSFPEMEHRYHSIEDAHDNTCSWLLKHQSYQDWLCGAQKGCLLMVRGKPGSGKSTALRKAFSAARGSASANTAVLAFFFNARGAVIESTLEGFFRSMLYQLFERSQNQSDECFVEWKRKSSTIRSGWTWTLRELRAMFVGCIKRASGQAFLFVDALDECESTSSARDLMELLARLEHDAVTDGSSPMVCVSSRHYPNVGVVEPLQTIVERQNAPDISAYTRNVLQGLVTDLDDLTQRVVSRSQGISLWAVLVLQQIRNAVMDGEPFRELHRLIASVPDRLEDLFQEILDATPLNQRESCDQIMMWVLFAARPLTLRELRFALAFKSEYAKYEHYEGSDEYVGIEQTQKLLVGHTRGLVELVETKTSDIFHKEPTSAFRVELIHESVRQYLFSKMSAVAAHRDLTCNIQGAAHSTMASSCFRYITAICAEIDYIPNPTGHLQKDIYNERTAFLDYAVRFSFQHASIAEASGAPATGIYGPISRGQTGFYSWWLPFTDLYYQTMNYNLPGDPLWALWAKWAEAHWISCYPDRTSSLVFACAFRIQSWVDIIVGTTEAPFSRSDLSEAMCVTAVSGTEATIDALVSAGADINCEVPLFGTPLNLAIVSQRLDMVTWLLRRNVSLNARGQQRNPPEGPFHLFADALDIVRLLLAHGLDVADLNPRTVTSPFGRHPLEVAAVLGSSQVLIELLKAAECQVTPANCYHEAWVSALIEARDYNANLIASALKRLHPAQKTTIFFVYAFFNRSGKWQELKVEMWEDAEVRLIKRLIQQETHLPLLRFKLRCGSQILQDQRLLSAYDMSAGMIKMVIPKRGTYTAQARHSLQDFEWSDNEKLES